MNCMRFIKSFAAYIDVLNLINVIKAIIKRINDNNNEKKP